MVNLENLPNKVLYVESTFCSIPRRALKVVNIGKNLWVGQLDGLMLTGVDTLHAVDTLRMTELFPRQV
jgi:hypothetical protein